MKTCLVVDDSSVIRKVARRILEGLEFQIVEAEDGEQALEACRRQLPEAILLDWNMGAGLANNRADRDSVVDSVLGVSDTQRELAVELDVDPYTDFPPLATLRR